MADYNSPFTGAAIDAAITKVAGIEAGADVTDTDNVTAAGALMDSEVTNLSGIKTLTVPDSTTISTFGATLVDDEDAATARTTLGVGSASDTAEGLVELATVAETTTGTDTGRAVTPDGLAGSIFGTQVVQLMVFDDSQDVATGDGAGDLFFRVPSTMNGMNLVAVAAAVQTAGTTGTTDIQVHNVTDTADMLSTVITIDSGETDSSTAATAAVINTATDDVATGDILRIDVDAVSTTAPKGLLVELQFRVP